MTAKPILHYALPGGWRWVRLGEVCRQDRHIVEPSSAFAFHLPYLSLEDIESHTGRILQRSGEAMMEDVRGTTFAFDNRHVLYGKLRPYLNKVALPVAAGRCTTEAIPLLPKEGVDRVFLAWLLRRKETIAAAMREKTGSRMPRVDMDTLFALEVPLPPLAEQRRIAALLTAHLDAIVQARTAAEARLEAARALPTALLHQVFASDEARGWKKECVAQLCERIDYGYTASADRAIQSPKFLRITDIQHGKVVWDTVPGCAIDPANEAAYLVADGDIVFARTGATTGKSFLLKNPPRAVFASYLIRLRPSAVIFPEYLYFFFQSDAYWSQIRMSARGGAQPHVNATHLGKFVVPVPALAKQELIVRSVSGFLAHTSRLSAAIAAQCDAMNALPAALLRRAFSGDL